MGDVARDDRRCYPHLWIAVRTVALWAPHDLWLIWDQKIVGFASSPVLHNCWWSKAKPMLSVFNLKFVSSLESWHLMAYNEGSWTCLMEIRFKLVWCLFRIIWFDSWFAYAWFTQILKQTTWITKRIVWFQTVSDRFESDVHRASPASYSKILFR